MLKRRSMTHIPHPKRFLFLLCAWSLLAAAACGGSGGGLTPPTETAQVERALVLATRMADTLQATNQVRYVHVTATAEANLSLLESARSWTIVLEDDFGQERGTWPTGPDEDILGDIDWRIQDGRYLWQANAVSGFVWWVLPEAAEGIQDFYLGVDVEHIDVPVDGEAGLVFRSNNESDYYNLSINNLGEYSIYMHSQDGWEEMIGWTSSGYILPGEVNRLEVIGIGSRMLIYINNYYLTTVQDDRLAEGEAGLIIGLSNAGDQGSWAFDNFELRAADSDLIEAHSPGP